jgi:hypothetical protein
MTINPNVVCTTAERIFEKYVHSMLECIFMPLQSVSSFPINSVWLIICEDQLNISEI